MFEQQEQLVSQCVSIQAYSYVCALFTWQYRYISNEKYNIFNHVHTCVFVCELKIDLQM